VLISNSATPQKLIVTPLPPPSLWSNSHKSLAAGHCLHCKSDGGKTEICITKLVFFVLFIAHCDLELLEYFSLTGCEPNVSLLWAGILNPIAVGRKNRGWIEN